MSDSTNISGHTDLSSEAHLLITRWLYAAGKIPCNPCHPRSIYLSPNFRSQLPVLLPALPSREPGWQRWQRLQ